MKKNDKATLKRVKVIAYNAGVWPYEMVELDALGSAPDPDPTTTGRSRQGHLVTPRHETVEMNPEVLCPAPRATPESASECPQKSLNPQTGREGLPGRAISNL